MELESVEEVKKMPFDWNEMELQSISDFITKGSTPTTYGFKWVNNGVTFLRSECVTEHGLDLSQAMQISNEAHKLLKRSEVTSNDILITITGNVGRVVSLKDDFGTGNINQHIARIRVLDDRVSNDYIYHFLSFPPVRKSFESIVTGLAYPQISLKQVREYRVLLPRSTNEQEAIAQALSDMDDLIDSLKKLIEKKRNIMKGAIQNLLMPNSNWVKKEIGNEATLKARIGWQGLTTSEYRETGNYLLITGTEFKDGEIDWNNCWFVDKTRYDQDKNIQVKENDVLVTKDGTIGKVAFVRDVQIPATLNSGVFVIRPKGNSFDPEFFYWVLMSNIFKEFLAELSAGSTISHLYQKDFVHFEFYTPPSLAEQADIATRLSNMNSEIELLEARLEKLVLIKKGMMQQLLTGKIRLV